MAQTSRSGSVLVEWRTNSESDRWYRGKTPMALPEIAEANGFYGWQKYRIAVECPAEQAGP